MLYHGWAQSRLSDLGALNFKEPEQLLQIVTFLKWTFKPACVKKTRWLALAGQLPFQALYDAHQQY